MSPDWREGTALRTGHYARWLTLQAVCLMVPRAAWLIVPCSSLSRVVSSSGSCRNWLLGFRWHVLVSAHGLEHVQAGCLTRSSEVITLMRCSVLERQKQQLLGARQSETGRGAWPVPVPSMKRDDWL